YKAAVLWEKISLVSTQRNKQGIVFLYDPFVAAGAAVAFPTQMSVNCPTGWMSNSLNYDSFVRSGAWGNIHEYNHNFQGYGCNGNDGEVTNNAISLVEYSLFTNISSARQIGSYGAAGMSGWNCYTSATWALNKVNKGDIGGTSGLAMYATLLHNFGQEAFMSASLGGRGVSYFQKWGDVTHNNMTYFLDLAKVYSLSGNGNDYTPLKTSQKNYPMFVPVSSVYQTGRSYMYDGQKKYITTMRPYNIRYGEDFDIDLSAYTETEGMYKSGSVVLPSGFSYYVKKVIMPEYGKLTKKSNTLYTYTPDPDHLQSGKMVVTLAITKNDGAFAVDDVDLVLEFKQSHEMNKTMLERTIYTFEEGNAPESAVAAFESDYSGYIDKTTVDNVNPVQNGNTEIWSKELLPDNTFYEVKGKIHISETAKYRIALRGRWDCALYTAVNEDENYTRVATVNTTATHANFYPNDENTYHDYDQLEAGDWLYFKAVLKSTHKGGTNAFIGVGFGQFVPPQGTLDEDGNLVDGNGNIIENPQETISISYANAYRANYEETVEQFTSEYFYLRNYSYTYKSDDVEYYLDGQSVLESNFKPWNNSYNINNLFDGNPNTTAHSAQQTAGTTANAINDKQPLVIDVDAGKTLTANCFTVFARNDSTNKTGLPISFKIEFRDTKDGEVKAVKTFANVTHAANDNVDVTLGEYISFRYYTLTVTKTENQYFVASSMGFSSRRYLDNGRVIEADNDMFRYDGDWSTESGLYTYGHIYIGKNNATMKFKFSGTAFALFAYNGSNYGGFDVYIDGSKAGSVTLNGEGSGSQRVFLSDDLKNGKHTVEIRFNNGVANIDNVVFWK
ncbi:MAG: M60 family metallopeptidase, partial [Clostridiales bacterium]|nr:M60 family metallopeptidase [Clostridiales bacterium]